MIIPQHNKDLNQGLLYLWSKLSDPSLNRSRVIARTSKWLTHRQTDTHKDACNDNTRSPKLASGKKLCNIRRDNYIQQARLPPNMQADPCVNSNAPSLGSSGEPGHPLYDTVLSWGGTPVHKGYTGPDAGILPYANSMEKHAYQAHFDGKKYTIIFDI